MQHALMMRVNLAECRRDAGAAYLSSMPPASIINFASSQSSIPRADADDMRSIFLMRHISRGGVLIPMMISMMSDATPRGAARFRLAALELPRRVIIAHLVPRRFRSSRYFARCRLKQPGAHAAAVIAAPHASALMS